MPIPDHIKNNPRHTTMQAGGWDTGVRKQTTIRGVKGTTVTYKKKTLGGKEELKVGGVPRLAGGVLATVATLGLANISSDFRNATWKEGVKELREGELGAERFGRGVIGVSAKVIGAGLGVIGAKGERFQQFEDETWGAAVNGKIETTATYRSPADTTPPTPADLRAIDVKYPGMLDYMTAKHGPRLTKSQASEILRYGYTPENRASIQWLFDPQNPKSGENRAKLVQLEGGMGFVQHNRTEVSSFIFIPGGDYTKARSVKVWHNNDGTKLTWQQLNRSMHDYSACYDDIQKGITGTVNTIAKRMKKSSPGMSNDELRRVKKHLRESLEQGSYVLDVESGRMRIYTKDLDLAERNPAGYTTGVEIKLSKEAQKALELNHNKKITENKKDLQQKAFEKDLPPIEQPRADQPLPEESEEE